MFTDAPPHPFLRRLMYGSVHDPDVCISSRCCGVWFMKCLDVGTWCQYGDLEQVTKKHNLLRFIYFAFYASISPTDSMNLDHYMHFGNFGIQPWFQCRLCMGISPFVGANVNFSLVGVYGIVI